MSSEASFFEWGEMENPIIGLLDGSLWGDWAQGPILIRTYTKKESLGGGFKYFSFSTLFGEDSHFD